MARKRRKLNKELEHQISQAMKKVELVTAIINDIQEEDIQTEYRIAFEPTKGTYLLLNSLYDTEGFTDQTDNLYKDYKRFLEEFEDNYEI